MRTGCPRQRGVTRESFGSVSAACSVCPPLKGGSRLTRCAGRLTSGAFWIVAAEPAAAASASEASARARFPAPKVPRPARHTCRQACASVWSTPNQGLLRPNPGSAGLHAGSREHPCANKHSATKSFPAYRKNYACVAKKARGQDRRRPVVQTKHERDLFAALSRPRLAYQGNAPSGALSSQTCPAPAGLSSVAWVGQRRSCASRTTAGYLNLTTSLISFPHSGHSNVRWS